MYHEISDHRNLELRIWYIIIIIITFHMKLLLNNYYGECTYVLKHTIVWYVIPISRYPDQASCDVHMKCVYYSSHTICMYTSCQY